MVDRTSEIGVDRIGDEPRRPLNGQGREFAVADAAVPHSGVLISIVIPVYNGARHLAACLDSVIVDRSGGLDVEIVCINDGSTDDTAKILAEFSARDERVHVVYQESRGAGAARNAGITAARGAWVVFLDADDLLLPGALATIRAAIAESDAEIIYFDYTRSLGGGTILPHSGAVRDLTAALPVLRRDAIEGETSSRRLMEHVRLISPCAKAYSRKWLVECDLRFIAGVRCGEDALFNIECLDAASRVAVCDDTIYYYRPNPASTTSSYDPRKVRESVTFAEQYVRTIAGLTRPPAALDEAVVARLLWIVVIATVRGPFHVLNETKYAVRREEFLALCESHVFARAISESDVAHRPLVVGMTRFALIHRSAWLMEFCRLIRRAVRAVRQSRVGKGRHWR